MKQTVGYAMLISYLSAVKNEELYIAALLESWIPQSTNTELIIVDDHSSDNTVAIARKYAQEIPNLQVYSGKESGVPPGKLSAFNFAWGLSSGDFVGFMSGDDELPVDAVAQWTRVLAPLDPTEPIAAFGKLRSMSTNPKFDGIVLPRGPYGNRSGGTSMFSRALAEQLFPLPTSVPAEDIWTSELSVRMANSVVELDKVILNYRIHENNSNPRQRAFPEMTRAMAARGESYRLMLEQKSEELSASDKLAIDQLWQAELLRREGRWVSLLIKSDLPPLSRLRFASMSKSSFWWVRQRFYAAFSGHVK